MFKPARWWIDKNKVKAVFKLQFQASQVTQVGGDGLVISVVPVDTGKATVKSGKAVVQDGSCSWENPVYETIKFNRDPRSGKIHERFYCFILGTGSSKSGVLGEVSIDFSNHVEATKVSTVSLPLKNSKSEVVLHVSIQRVQESMDQREIEENENANLYLEDQSLSPQLGNHDYAATIRSDSVEDVPSNKTVSQAAFNTKQLASSGSDVTLSSSGSSCGIETTLELKNDNDHQETDGYLSSSRAQGPQSDTPTPTYEEHKRSWEWLQNSGPEDGATDDSSSTVRDAFPGEHSEESPDVMEKMKADVVTLSRQAEMSELELQALRKQVARESKRGQDLGREVVDLKEERDALMRECDRLKAFKRRTDETTNLLFDGMDSRAIVEELRQELHHAKELNANLRVQLEKTQEANSELILAVQDLEEMLERGNGDMSNPSGQSMEKDVNGKSREVAPTYQPNRGDDDDDDEEQKALEDLVKEHNNEKEPFLLEQQIMDLRSEIEIYKRDKDEIEMQMEQLALDYEIMKQANHDLSCQLEQSQIQEQLKLQYECSSPDMVAHELEAHVENLENELKIRSKEHEDSSVKIRELKANVKSLEEELERHARGFEADLEAVMQTKVEQEQRAIRAEEMLKKIRWKNANTAERLQDEFKKLSMQMASTFEANEKLATKALADANELRLQKSHLEEMLRRTSDEHQSVEGHYETRLQQLTSQVKLMADQIERMQSEIEDREIQLEHQRKLAEETEKALTDEILVLRDEIEMHIAKNKILSEEMGGKKALVHELDRMKLSIKEMELIVEQGNDEKTELESQVLLMKTEADELHKELNKTKSLVKEKELATENLQSGVDSLQAKLMKLKHSMSEDEQENEKLKKQVLQLRSDLKKKEDFMEKKTKDGRGRSTTLDAAKAASKTSKPQPRESKEFASLKERIKLLESQIKSKEAALEKSANASLEKEKDLLDKIEELEGKLEVNQSSARPCESEELRNEMALLKQRNESMERDLMEMQERYLDISLKFAEVEGERQQLVIKLRNLTNASKSS